MKVEELNALFKKALETIKERDVNPCQAAIASLIAGLNAIGVLNQSVALKMSEWAAPIFYASLVNEGIAKMELEHDVGAFFKGLGYEDGTYTVKLEDSLIDVRVKADRCKVCPRSVGLADIPSSACPLPGALMAIAEIITQKKWDIVKERNGARVIVVKREGGECHFRIRKVEGR